MPSSGTLRSDLTMTTRPRTPAASRSESDCTALKPRTDERDQVDQPARVTPLVVVPTDDLHRRPADHGHGRVEGAGGGSAHDVAGDNRVLGVDEVALQRAIS